MIPPPDSKTVKAHRGMIRVVLRAIEAGPKLGRELPRDIGIPDALEVGERLGLFRARCLQKIVDSNIPSVWEWTITERGKRFLTEG